MGDTWSSDTAPTTDELLRVLIVLAGRLAVPPERLRDIVSPSGSQKYIEAYNLCDGTLGLTDVARMVGLDKSNLSKSLGRWVEAGVVFKVGGANLLHIYRLPPEIGEGNRQTREEDAGPGLAPIPPTRPRRARTPVKRAMTEKAFVSGAGHRTSDGGNGELSRVSSALELPEGENDSPERG